MGKKSFTYIIIFLWLLSGCTLAPEYIRPEAKVPDRWPKGEAYKTGQYQEIIPTELSWHDFFTDQRLKKIIRSTLRHNLDLRLAALHATYTYALFGVQRAELFPVLEGSASRSKQRLPDTYGFGRRLILRQYSVGLGITSWEIDFFGRIRSLKEKALEEYLATEEGRRSVQVSLISQVGRAYFSLAADRENLRLARSTLATQRATYDLVRKRYEAGLATELDLKRSQTQVETAKRDISKYVQAVAQDKNVLDLLTGYHMPGLTLPSDLNSAGTVKDIFCGISSDLLLNRPDIMAAEHRLKGAYAFIGAARAAFFPRISLTTALGTASSDLSGLFGAGSKSWQFVTNATMPIFDARTWAAYRVSKAEKKIALVEYQKTIQAAFKEVADSLAVKGTIDQQISAQQALCDALSSTYRLSLERYTDGIDSYLSVLDAQRNLYAAKQQLVFLRLARIANMIELYAALGGGTK